MKSCTIALCTLALSAFTLPGCGPSTAQLRQARESAYNTDFATVWNAIDAEMRERFGPDGLKIVDPVNGVIESKWKGIEVHQEADGVGNVQGGTVAQKARAGNLFRMVVRILPGGPPWNIFVDGEAAQYRAELAMLTPYRHGDIDEPQWVPGRIDAVVASLHDRLKAYAVTAQAVHQAAPSASQPTTQVALPPAQ